MSARIALRSIKTLYNTSNKGNSVRNNIQLIEDAFTIYNQVPNNMKDYYLVNEMAKLCLHHQQADKIWCIWDDINYLLQQSNHDNIKKYVSFPLLIKCCIESNNIDRGKEIHSKIPCYLSHNDLSIKTALIDFYGHCKHISTSIDIFESVANKQKDASIINTMMKVFIDNNKSGKALEIYKQYESLIELNDRSKLLAIKTCMNLNDFEMGKHIINQTNVMDNSHSIELLNTVINFYGNFKQTNDAIVLFDNINKKSSATINCMMQAFINNDHNKEAISLYDEFKSLRSDRTNVLAIKSCINLGDYGVKKGKEIHENIQNVSNHNIFIATALIDFYGSFGDISSAIDVFENIKNKNVVCCNSMMTICIANDLYNEALAIYDRFKKLSNDTSHLLAIQVCINTNDFKKGKQILDGNMKKKRKSIQLRNSCIMFYGHFNDVDNAIKAFNNINENEKQCSTINNMMQAFIGNVYYSEALQLYNKYDNKFTDHISHLLAIKACTNLTNRGYENGVKIHNKLELLSDINDMKIQSSLIAFYSKFNDIQTAETLFDDIDNKYKTKELINCMMQGYIENNYNEKALLLYDKNLAAAYANDISHILALKACANIRDFQKGNNIICLMHGDNQSIELKNTLIHFHGNNGNINAAIDTFNDIENHTMDIITINAMMTAYFNNKLYKECIKLFQNLRGFNNKLKPVLITYVLLFKACAQSSCLQIGERMHNKLRQCNRNKEILQDASIQINLINMYAKCGMIKTCEELFDQAGDNRNDVDIWNAMINAYGFNGDIDKVHELYELIQFNHDIVMNNCTYSVLINVYSHNGDIDKVCDLWKEIERDVNIRNDLYVISAVVDGFSRNAYLKKAYKITCDYEEKNGIVLDIKNGLWMSLLSGCKQYNDVKLANIVFNEMYKRFGNDSACYDYMQSATKLLKSAEINVCA